MFIAKTVNDPQSFNKIYKNMYADIDAPKQEQPVPEEKKEEPFTIQGQLKKAQDEISALGDKATVENMAKPLSQIITCTKIQMLQNKGTFNHITEEQFNKLDEAGTFKDPSFKAMLDRTEPSVLASQATADKGQNLFGNYQKTTSTVKTEENAKKETERTTVKNTELGERKTIK